MWCGRDARLMAAGGCLRKGLRKHRKGTQSSRFPWGHRSQMGVPRGTLSQESVNDGAGRRPTEGAAAVVRREPGEQRA